MSTQIDNIARQVSRQLPKAGVWLALENIQKAINIAFSTIYQTIKLAIVLAGLYYIYNNHTQIIAFFAK